LKKGTKKAFDPMAHVPVATRVQIDKGLLLPFFRKEDLSSRSSQRWAIAE
jgi:hypothetical protein